MAQETSHYTVLARRFRPQQFDEVVGQQHVAQSLKNAIRAGRVAHAYLFTGARGVGKTSMARILAKALNCPNAEDGVPCNQCEICDGISAGNDVDISEIDGASNRGIDDIRSLRANVNVKSMRTKYKVYIVDEVHMLTREAFNALLKTLEEPPPGVKFVFCTTEPNKVPDTILSRCQRFDFSSINTQRISERLTEIASVEGVEVEPAAVELVARRAAGSMRDSQSLFDQLLAFGGDKLTSADVHKLLGTADDDRLIAIFAAVVSHDAAEALNQFDKAIESGVQPGELINQLLACGRDLMVLTAGAESLELIGISESNRAGLTDLGNSWGIETVIAALQILGETRDKLMRTTQSRALAELAIVRLAVLEDLSQISALLSGNMAAPVATSPKKKNAEPVAPRIESKPEPVAQEPAPPLTIPKPKPAAPQPAEPAESEPAKISETQESSLPHVEAKKGNETTFHAQLIDSMKDTARDHIKLATVAISGPNQVALRFSKSYHFNKRYCERPEILGRLQKAASEIARAQVHLRVDLVDDPEGTAPRTVKPREPEKTINPEEDAFLQEAVHLFRATVVRTERL
ncbi:MAG: DNA polymerase III subunit gamma/tau [Planctomycetaceae bacterium]